MDQQPQPQPLEEVMEPLEEVIGEMGVIRRKTDKILNHISRTEHYFACRHSHARK